MKPILEFRKIEKAFFGVRVLKGISFSVPEGSILGIVGENGAGKSTMMNILGGNLRADGGEILIGDERLVAADPRESERRGIAFIHQELNLFPNLSIAENLFLTRFPRAGGLPWIKRGELNRRAAELLKEVGLDVSPDRSVETLSAGERQLLEVAKALSFNARIIIFDEPTTSLTSREIEVLFALIAKLRARGMTMIYISHALQDVFRLCDDILVLRDGEVVAHDATETFSTDKLISLMVGRSLEQVFPGRAKTRSGEVLLEVRRLVRGEVIRDVSFSLRAGEVLGISGLMGAGRSELARAIFGLDRRSSGEVRIHGETVRKSSPRAMIRRGLAFLTENRRSEGLCMDGSIAENLTLAALPIYSKHASGWLSRENIRTAVQKMRGEVHLDAKARSEQPIRTLSGGNQQKVVLGKWLLRNPKILILDEPTRGVDVGAKAEIYRLISELAGQGMGILLISSEIEELIGLSDCIVVMRGGTIVDELARAEFDRERILRAALKAA
ncbi:MAG TPA: sugar ABC transporter ATP-binding protein [Verrucomicrobiae bacterium]